MENNTDKKQNFGRELLLKICIQHPNDEFPQTLLAKFEIFEQLYHRCGDSFRTPCGSYLFDGKTYQYDASMYEKQQLLYSRAKLAESVLEIGVYMGHSALIMLLANPRLHFTGIDISDQYAAPAMSYLQEVFPEATLKFICQDSIGVLPPQKFDLFHIDGDHSAATITGEFKLSRQLIDTTKKQIAYIFDDYNGFPEAINQLISTYAAKDVVLPNCAWRNIAFNIEVENIINALAKEGL
jgi:hypothetical protein